jgi:hypothetical protein
MIFASVILSVKPPCSDECASRGIGILEGFEGGDVSSADIADISDPGRVD